MCQRECSETLKSTKKMFLHSPQRHFRRTKEERPLGVVHRPGHTPIAGSSATNKLQEMSHELARSPASLKRKEQPIRFAMETMLFICKKKNLTNPLQTHNLLPSPGHTAKPDLHPLSSANTYNPKTLGMATEPNAELPWRCVVLELFGFYPFGNALQKKPKTGSSCRICCWKPPGFLLQDFRPPPLAQKANLHLPCLLDQLLENMCEFNSFEFKGHRTAGMAGAGPSPGTRRVRRG